MSKRTLILFMCLLLAAALPLPSWGADQINAESLTGSGSLQSGQNTDYERHKETLQRLQHAITAGGAISEPVPQMPTGRTTPPYSPKLIKPAVACNALYPCGIGFNPAVDYTLPNFAQSPNIRKFVDSLPGAGLPGCTVSSPTPGTGSCNENNLGQYIPVANPDTNTYPGSDYYELGVMQYSTKMNSDLPPTALRGYYQINNGTVGGTSHAKQYLGPLVIATRNKPVRLLLRNQLGINGAGNLPLPVDTTIMGAGQGPVNKITGAACDMGTAPANTCATYTQNRISNHLHGGLSPWISDGTPHQWFTPAGDSTFLKKGVSFQDVPDMVAGPLCAATPASKCITPSTSDGVGTFFYTNQESPRLLFYHDHAYGLTRLNVYAGIAAGYLITDPVEEDLISGSNTSGINSTHTKYLPDLGGAYHYGIPLVIQDKAFVNDPTGTYGPATPPGPGFPAANYIPTASTASTDPLWYTYVGAPTGGQAGGSLWFPHEYMPIENVFDPSGNTPNGRWDYAPFMIPPGVPLNLTLPSPTIVPETFVDTATVNGTAFPYLNLPADAVRFRMLSVGNDRSFNLQLYRAAVAPALVTFSGGCTTAPIASTSVHNGVVTGITLLSGGGGCTSAPGVTISDVSTGTGGGASATAVIDATAGVVTGFKNLVGGSNFLAGTICKTPLPGYVTTLGYTTTTLQPMCTEVSMVPAAPNPAYPSWPQDGRDGGVPDPTTQGPPWIQIGNESGFLAQVAVWPQQPVDYEYNRQNIPLAGVTSRTLFLMPAMRADVIVDFHTYTAGDVFIMYNDAPAPAPNYWTINDYYTDDPDQRSVGAAPPTPPGFGPNTRTMMQIRLVTPGAPSGLDFSVTATPGFTRTSPIGSFLPPNLSAPFGASFTNLQTMLPKAFAAAQDKPHVPQCAYNAAFPGFAPQPPPACDTFVQGYMDTLNLTGVAQPAQRILTIAPGNNYTAAPSVIITGGSCSCINPLTGQCPLTTATAGLNPSGGITLLTAGTGYTSPPTVTIGLPGAGGVRATAVATISGGQVTALTISEPGSNYSAVTAATCTITGGGGTGATCSTFVAVTNTVGSIKINTAFSCTSQPLIFLTPNNANASGASAVTMLTGALVFTGKSMTEGFDVEYGRMDIRLGSTPNALTPNVGNGMVLGLARYIDPPTEQIQAGQVILWRLTHLGVDSHAMHFHLFDLQVVNRVDWTNVVKPPYLDEIGWRETIRTNPMEDIILAIKPKQMLLPFSIPDSQRVLDPTTPVNSTTNFYPVAPPAGIAAVPQVINAMTMFASEYVFHCHLLGHEENDMMRPMVFLTPPWMPTIGTATAGVTAQATVNCTAPGTGGSPITSYTATSSSGVDLVAHTATGTACPLTVTGLTLGVPYTFTVQATNAYGTGQASNASNVVVAGPPVTPTGVTIGISFATPLRIFLNWTNGLPSGTGITIQRATNGGFTTGLTAFNVPISTSFTDTTAAANTIYYYRMRSTVGATVSAWSPILIMSTAAPAVPVWVSSVPTATSVALTWTEAQTSGSNNWGGFEIWWSTDPTFTAATAVAFLGAAPPFTYTATFGITTGTTFYFQMRARNGSSNSAVFTTPVRSVTTP